MQNARWPHCRELLLSVEGNVCAMPIYGKKKKPYFYSYYSCVHYVPEHAQLTRFSSWRKNIVIKPLVDTIR